MSLIISSANPKMFNVSSVKKSLKNDVGFQKKKTCPRYFGTTHILPPGHRCPVSHASLLSREYIHMCHDSFVIIIQTVWNDLSLESSLRDDSNGR